MHLKTWLGAAGILVSVALQAQPGERALKEQTINWTGITTNSTLTNPNRQVLNGAQLGYRDNGLPELILTETGIAGSSLQLSNTEFVALTPDEAKLIPVGSAATEPEIRTQVTYEKGQPVTHFFVVPIRVNPQTGQKEKLLRFSYAVITEAYKTPPVTVRRAAGTSVLAGEQEVYKLAVTGSGVYKISANFLRQIGVNLQQANPAMLKIYGNGGGMLPEPVATPRYDDLVENATYFSGNADAVFDDAEYLLFYAQGPHKWVPRLNSDTLNHQYNIYSDTAYYYLAIGNTPGKRVTTAPIVPQASTTFSTFQERAFYEKEESNLLQSGRRWQGEIFSSFTNTREFTLPAAGLVANTPISIRSVFVNTSPVPCSFTIFLNNQRLGVSNLNAVLPVEYGDKANSSERTFRYSFASPPAEFKVKINYTGGGGSEKGTYLDFIELNYTRALKLFNQLTAFRVRFGQNNTSTANFEIADMPSGSFVWDITNTVNPKAVQGQFMNGNYLFTSDSLAKREFIAFTAQQPEPQYKGKVAAQNLHSLNTDGLLDLVIVTYPAFKAQAERLAQHRRTHDNLQAVVVTTTQVYNEFSSGAQDPVAIRDLMKMVYDRRANPDKNMYLLLFGDASYDYKSRVQNNTNFVPVFYSPESFNNISSQSTEDFYACLDNTEGYYLTPEGLDIGVGRLPVGTQQEAQIVVDKLIHYNSSVSFGNWRHRVTYLCDDEAGFLNDSDTAARYLEDNYKQYNIKKLYLDAYPQVSVPSGERAPEVADLLNKAVNQGSLIVNYIGHGGETGWAGERVLDIPQINQWTNYDRLTFLVTATCEFGRYDDPARASGAENSLLQPAGGAMGLLSTTRPVYQNFNREIVYAFTRSVFRPEQNEMPRLGDVLRKTKNLTSNLVVNRNFTLLGDPSARLAYPEQNIAVTRINNISVSALPDTLKALALVKIDGEVRSALTGAVLTDFDQQLHATVYEKKKTVYTLNNAGAGVKSFEVQENVIYAGLSAMHDGMFTFQFVVPRDIAYNLGYGKVSLYASNPTTDAGGYYSNILIGGSDPNAIPDNQAPRVQLFMDDTTFVFGGTTGNNATLLAKLYDNNGINTAGLGIGHELKATLDDKKEYLLNEFYTADVNSYQSGKVNFPVKDLSPGPHSFKVKAWDTHNNAADGYIEFIVVNNAALALAHVLNYPNPFTNQTTFHFDHNRAGDELEVMVQIYTVSGKLVKTLIQPAAEPNSRAHIQSLTWDGRDEFNDSLAKGVYVYKVSVKSRRDNSKAHQYQKLVILK